MTLAPTSSAPALPRALPHVLLGLLSLIWGSSFLLMKRALLVFQPAQLGALRMAIAAACLLPLVVHSRASLGKVPWRTVALVGLLGNGIPAFLFANAQTGLDSGTTGVLNSLTPVFAVAIGVTVFGDRVAPSRLAGVALGLVGAACLVLSRSGGVFHFDALHVGMVMLATACYAVSVNLIRHRLAGMRPLHIAGLALTTVGIPSAIWLVATDIGATLRDQPGAWTALGYVATLAALGTAVSVVLYSRLIQIAGSVYATSVTYLIPVVALTWGVLDGEAVGPMHAVGLCTLLAGVYLANRSHA